MQTRFLFKEIATYKQTKRQGPATAFGKALLHLAEKIQKRVGDQDQPLTVEENYELAICILTFEKNKQFIKDHRERFLFSILYNNHYQTGRHC